MLIHMAKNVLRKQFGNMYGENKPYQLFDRKIFESKPLPPIEPPMFSVTGIILFTLAIIATTFLYLNRDKAYEIAVAQWNQFKPIEQVDQLEKLYHDLTQPPEPEVKPKEVIPTLEKKEEETKEVEKKDQSGGVKKLDERLSRYSEEQRVKSDGFCYIGYDPNRECTPVSEGDICMSGQIFPTLEVCMNPHLRP